MTRLLFFNSTSKHGWAIVYTLTCSQQERAWSRKKRYGGAEASPSLAILCKTVTGLSLINQPNVHEHNCHK